MDIPITLEDLKDQIHELIPGASFDTDEDSDEIIIRTNLIEGANGDLEQLELDFEPGDIEFDGDEDADLLEDDADVD